MTLRELSQDYRAAAQLLRQRLRELRQREKVATDADERFWLSRRSWR